MHKKLFLIALCLLIAFASKEQDKGPKNVCTALDKETALKYKAMGPEPGMFRQILSGYSSHCYSILKLSMNEHCVVKKAMGLPFNLTRPCAECYAVSSTCGSQHCKLACLGRTMSPSCISCVDEHCTPATEVCSGILS
jgi:hypothetical protein|uniref:Uncharacterized protein n=1 Tax=Eutreptiella gymnastica TaxID=73025 RepID=A0A7S4GHC2_9EUGL